MASVNKVTIVGNLGADPELRTTPDGQKVCSLSIATSENWTDKSGQKQEKTQWHRVSVWGKMAEVCAQYLAKGRQVYVEGKLNYRQWDDKETGQKRYATDIVSQTVQFLGSKSDQPQNQGQKNNYQTPGDQQGGGQQFNDNDIPF